MPNYINYINGEWKNTSEATVPINDAGFLLGDGLFETIRFENKKLFSSEKHLKRLTESLNVIQIQMGKTNDDIKIILNQTIQKNMLHSGLLRLMITRGNVDGPPWKYSGPPSIYVSIRPLSAEPEAPVKIVFYNEKKYPIIRFNPAIKSLNYIGNMLAKKDAQDDGAFEPVFYNHDGFITECAIRNIFFIKKDVLLTPDLKLGVLPGVMRNAIISIAKEMNLTFREDNIPIKSINEMDEAFISSTGIGLLPCSWDGWKSDFTITIKLKKKLNELISTTL